MRSAMALGNSSSISVINALLTCSQAGLPLLCWLLSGLASSNLISKGDLSTANPGAGYLKATVRLLTRTVIPTLCVSLAGGWILKAAQPVSSTYICFHEVFNRTQFCQWGGLFVDGLLLVCFQSILCGHSSNDVQPDGKRICHNLSITFAVSWGGFRLDGSSTLTIQKSAAGTLLLLDVAKHFGSKPTVSDLYTREDAYSGLLLVITVLCALRLVSF